MTHNGNRGQPTPDNSSLILGILIGVVLGLAAAGGMAWYLTHHRPDMFTNKDQAPAQTQHASTAAQKPPAASNTPAPGATPGSKNNYTFYTLLPDNKNGTPPAAANTPVRQAAATGKTYYLQAGSFTNEKEANSLRQKLAFLGLETHVQTANIPGKGLHYRVRLGPYHSTDEMNKADRTLKQNGVPNAAQIRNP